MKANPTITEEDVRRLLEEGRQIRLAVQEEMKKVQLTQIPRLLLR